MAPKRYCCNLHQRVFCLFSSKSFIVSSVIFTSLIYFELIFAYGVTECSNFILLHVAVQFSQHYLIWDCLPSIIYSCFLCCRLIHHWCMGYFWVFYPVPLAYTSVFVPVLFWWLQLCSIVSSQGAWFFQLFFFLRNALAIWDLLCFYTHFKFFCSGFVKNANGNLIGIVLSL